MMRMHILRLPWVSKFSLLKYFPEIQVIVIKKSCICILSMLSSLVLELPHKLLCS